jgi:hypothetical protein
MTEKKKPMSKNAKILLVGVSVCIVISGLLTIYDVRTWVCRVTKGNFCLLMKGPARFDHGNKFQREIIQNSEER